MATLKLILGCWHYDRTRALADGSVQPEGIELEYRTAPQVGAIMERAMKGEFDVSELGITYYLRSLEQPDPPFIAIPVFPIVSSATARSSSTRIAASKSRAI